MTLTKSQTKILNYCKEHADLVYDMSIVKLASNIFVDPSTISRLCKKLKFESFIEFKIYIKQNYSQVLLHEDFDDYRMNYQTIINSTINKVDIKIISEIAKMMLFEKKILLIGIGSSLQALEYLKKNLIRLGIEAILEREVYMLSSVINNYHKNNNILCFSHSGETELIVEQLKQIKINNYNIAYVGSNSQSTIAKLCTNKIIYNDYIFANTAFANLAFINQVIICDMLLHELSKKIKYQSKFNSQI